MAASRPTRPSLALPMSRLPGQSGDRQQSGTRAGRHLGRQWNWGGRRVHLGSVGSPTWRSVPGLARFLSLVARHPRTYPRRDAPPRSRPTKPWTPAGIQRIRCRALTVRCGRFTVRAMLCRLSSRFIGRLAACLLITVFSVMSPAIAHWSTRADECEPTAVQHDTNAHRFVRSETPQTDAGHCGLCHSTRAFRSDLSSKSLLPQPTRLLGRLVHDLSAWAAHVAWARIPARSPPALSIV